MSPNGHQGLVCGS